MWQGKKKAVTFSFDDGVLQDIRLIALLNKYGLKSTFNINSSLLGLPGALVREGKYVEHNKVMPSELKAIYEGHEVAVHTLTHPFLPDLGDEAISYQVEEDRKKLSELCGYEVVGMAYPNGDVDDRVRNIIREKTGVKYSRSAYYTHTYDLSPNLLDFRPSVYHHIHMNIMFQMGEKFLEMKPDQPQIFCVFGHAYEFDIRDDWARFEEFLKMMSGRSDICYCTNREALLV